MAQSILNTIDEFNLTDQILGLTSDNASNIISAGRQISLTLNNNNNANGFQHYRCCAHILNLAVQAGLAKQETIISKLRIFLKKIRKSSLLLEDLQRIATSDSQSFLRPILDSKIRWNSTFYMLKRASTIRLQLEMLCVRHSDLRNEFPTENNWNIIEV